MGEVFLAEDTELERLVALKVLPKDLANDTERMPLLFSLNSGYFLA